MVFNGKEKIKIAIRVDASEQIGSGHLMRCLTLADSLKSRAEIHFITRKLKGALPELIAEKGYAAIHELQSEALEEALQGYEKWLTVKRSTDAKQTRAVLRELKAVDWLIVDHYALEESWENDMRPYARKIFVIDDLANRRHDCDILLDQNYYKDRDERYKGLVPEQCQLWLGPAHAILRPEFYEERKRLRQRDGTIRRILIFFGGSDADNETSKAMRAVEMLERSDLQVDVVVGKSNPHRMEIEEDCKKHENWQYHCQIDCMARLMNEADLAIGAGGTTTWERCYMGLPALVVSVAENQEQIAKDCAEYGCIVYLGDYRDVSIRKIKEKLIQFLREPLFVKTLIIKNMELGRNNTCMDNWKKLLFI